MPRTPAPNGIAAQLIAQRRALAAGANVVPRGRVADITRANRLGAGALKSNSRAAKLANASALGALRPNTLAANIATGGTVGGFNARVARAMDGSTRPRLAGTFGGFARPGLAGTVGRSPRFTEPLPNVAAFGGFPRFDTRMSGPVGGLAAFEHSPVAVAMGPRSALFGRQPGASALALTRNRTALEAFRVTGGRPSQGLAALIGRPSNLAFAGTKSLVPRPAFPPRPTFPTPDADPRPLAATVDKLRERREEIERESAEVAERMRARRRATEAWMRDVLMATRELVDTERARAAVDRERAEAERERADAAEARQVAEQQRHEGREAKLDRRDKFRTAVMVASLLVALASVGVTVALHFLA